VATHNDGYYDVLRQSVERLGLTLETQGWGQTYQGFAWMRGLIKEKIDLIADTEPDEIVLLVDGFDVFIHTQSLEKILFVFKEFQAPIVIGAEGTSVWYQDLLSRGVFGQCLGTYINAGGVIGYASALKTLFEYWYEVGDESKNDQLMLSRACRGKREPWFRHNVKVDTDMRLFATFPCALVPNHALRQIVREKQSLIIHGNGNCDMDRIILENGLDLAQISKRGNYMWGAIAHYAYFYMRHILALILILGFVIMKILY